MIIKSLKLFGFDKLLVILDMCIHFVHFYDISAIYCKNCINTYEADMCNEVVEMCFCLQLSE